MCVLLHGTKCIQCSRLKDHITEKKRLTNNNNKKKPLPLHQATNWIYYSM